MTAVVAFLMGGLVVLATGHNPFSTYKAIFNGTGLNWLFPGRPAPRGPTPRRTSSRR